MTERWQGILSRKNGNGGYIPLTVEGNYGPSLQEAREKWTSNPNSKYYTVLAWLPWSVFERTESQFGYLSSETPQWRELVVSYGCDEAVAITTTKPRRAPDHAPNYWDLPKVDETSAKQLGNDYMAAVRASSGDKRERK